MGYSPYSDKPLAVAPQHPEASTCLYCGACPIPHGGPAPTLSQPLASTRTSSNWKRLGRINCLSVAKTQSDISKLAFLDITPPEEQQVVLSAALC